MRNFKFILEGTITWNGTEKTASVFLSLYSFPLSSIAPSY